MQGITLERRAGDRRSRNVNAYFRGSVRPRRREGRRRSDHYAIVDWHSPRILAPVLAILGLSVLDGVFTVMLMAHGASEVNPIMALLLPHNLGLFAAVKLSLTGLGVGVLVACSRMRLFGTLRGEILLYAIVCAYVALVIYELRLLALVPHIDA